MVSLGLFLVLRAYSHTLVHVVHLVQLDASTFRVVSFIMRPFAIANLDLIYDQLYY